LILIFLTPQVLKAKWRGGGEGEEEEAKLWGLHQVLHKLTPGDEVMLVLPSHQVIHLAPWQWEFAHVLWIVSPVVW